MKTYTNILLILLLQAVYLSAGTVSVGGEKLFSIEAPSGEQSPQERSVRATKILDSLLVDASFPAESIKFVEGDKNFYIKAKHITILAVSDKDTTGTGLTKKDLAARWTEKIQDTIRFKRRIAFSPREIFRIGALITIPFVIILIFFLLRKLNRSVARFVVLQEDRILRGFKIGHLQLLTPNKEVNIILKLLVIVRFIIFFIFVYFTLSVYLRQFDETNRIILTINNFTIQYLIKAGHYLADGLKVIISAIILYLILRFILFITNYLMQHYKEVNILSGNMTEPGFNVVIKIFRGLAIVLFFLGVIYIIPGGRILSMALLVITVIIIGVSSINTLKNFISGTILMSKNLFDIGDMIICGEFEGTVEEKNLLYVVLKSVKGSKIIIHNHIVLSAPLIVKEKNDL